MNADEARRRSEANARRAETRAHNERLEKDAKERASAEREAKKVLPRIEEEIEKAVSEGAGFVRIHWLDEKLARAVSALLSKKGYRSGMVKSESRDPDAWFTEWFEVTWKDESRGR